VIKVVNALEARLEDIKESIDVAVIGCIVNGPGEAKEADVGLAGGSPANLAYRDGEKSHKISNEDLLDELEKMARAKVAEIQQKSNDDNMIVRSPG